MIAKHCRVWPEATKEQVRSAAGFARQYRRPYALVARYIAGTGTELPGWWVPWDERGKKQYCNSSHVLFVPVVIAYPVLS